MILWIGYLYLLVENVLPVNETEGERIQFLVTLYLFVQRFAPLSSFLQFSVLYSRLSHEISASTSVVNSILRSPSLTEKIDLGTITIHESYTVNCVSLRKKLLAEVLTV